MAALAGTKMAGPAVTVASCGRSSTSICRMLSERALAEEKSSTKRTITQGEARVACLAFGLEGPSPRATFHLVTMLTNRPGTTTTLTIVLPSVWRLAPSV